MTLKILKDYHALSLFVADQIITVLRAKPDAVLCLAAGDTPRDAYAFLHQKVHRDKVDVSKCTFIGLDEWVGVPPQNEGSCSFFLTTNLFEPLGIASRQIHLFRAMSDNLASECSRMNETVAALGGIDLMLVGVGINGHVGFNEPGVSADLYSHVMVLDDITKKVGQKYFNQETPLQYGITLGLKHLLESQRALLIASGEKKAAVMRTALEEPISAQVPASVIRKHPDAIVILDEDAASALSRGHGERISDKLRWVR